MNGMTLTGLGVFMLALCAAPLPSEEDAVAAAPGGVSQPFKGAPAVIPGTINCVDFDKGGEGVAFGNPDPSTPRRTHYRPWEGILVEPSGDAGCGFNIGGARRGMWFNYTVDVKQAGKYLVEARVADMQSQGGVFHLEFAGRDATGPIEAPTTGNWQVYRPVTAVADLRPSVQVMRLCLDRSGSSGFVANFSRIKFTREGQADLHAAEASPADKSMAAAIAAGAAKLAAEGKTEKARELCYKALANDADCAEALYELGKIFEKEGKTITAGDFYFRAAQQFGKGEAGNPAFATKRQDAERRVKALNPYAMRLAGILADYTQELNAITKKTPDSLTLEEACDRADVLNLRTILAPDKGPKFARPETKTPAKDDSAPDKSSFVRRSRQEEAPTSVPPEVERALKAAGWTTITGTWKKKADNVYEVSDGKLETEKFNGAVQVIVHKGGTGSVKVMVRNYLKENEGYSGDHWATGFGWWIEGGSAKIYFPDQYGAKFDSHLDRVESLPAAMPKNKVTVTVNEGKLEYILNDKALRRGSYPIPKNGPFVIAVEGTMTIESPQAVGQ